VNTEKTNDGSWVNSPEHGMLPTSEARGEIESVRSVFDAAVPGPAPEWVRGKCPECGDHLVSNCYYVGGRGYIICWECWASLGERPTCNYRKVI
jgi:hypothetical protein